MKLFWMLALHCLCDYPLQGDFLARAKNTGDVRQEQAVEALEAYAAHVTKGLEARLAQLIRQLHDAADVTAQLEAAEARNVELMGADVQRAKDISRLTVERDEARKHETELMGELERARQSAEFSAQKLLEEQLASIALEKRLAEAEKALEARLERALADAKDINAYAVKAKP